MAEPAEVRAIAYNRLILVVEGQQALTVSGTDSENPYGIRSTDKTVAPLGLER